MRLFFFIFIIILSFGESLDAQIYHGNFLVLKNRFSKRDTSSASLLKKHKDVPDLRVQIRESYEHHDLQIFKEIPELENLSIHNNSMTSLKGIEHLKKLKLLSIHSNSITDFSGLLEINQLTELIIKSSVPIDLELDFPQLKSNTYTCNYDLAKCNFPIIKDITIKQVAELDLHYDDENYGVDYKVKEAIYPIELTKFDSLSSILLYEMEIKSLDEIAFPKRLKKLMISDCMYLEDVDQIQNFESLEYLRISFCNQIENFEFLKKLEDVSWTIYYQGREYSKSNLNQLLNHPDGTYYFIDEGDPYYDGQFYNFDKPVIAGAKEIFKKYHQQIIETKPARKEFLNLIVPIIKELNELCTDETCNITWDDEESYHLIYFLKEMAQLAGHQFDESHLWRQFENAH